MKTREPVLWMSGPAGRPQRVALRRGKSVDVNYGRSGTEKTKGSARKLGGSPNTPPDNR